MESLAFVALAPIAFALMLAVCVAAWQRRAAAGGWALVTFSVVEMGWLSCDTLGLIAPTPGATVRFAQGSFAWSPLLGAAWVAFVLSYTGRMSRAARVGVGVLTAWCLVYGAFALTNGAHRLVWTDWHVVADGPFRSIRYTLGPLAEVQTGFAWTSILASLGVILWTYVGSDARARDLSRWLVVGALVPMAFNITFMLGVGPSARDFTPIAMAISSGAFALGLARYRFLDLRPIARAALVDNLRDGMLVLDAQGRVADANPALRHALGAAAVQIGRPLAETAPALASALATAPDAVFHVGEGDEARAFDLRVSPLSDRSGASADCLVLLHDVTVRRRERLALHHANAELQARNDELDAFAHTVAHDLKNSIHGVLGWAEVLRDDGPALAPSMHREIAEDVVGTARKMKTVVHELLLLAGVRQAAVDVQPLAMATILGEALDRLRPQARLDVRPSAAGWPGAVGYAPWVEEVWVNYLSNAAKYGGPTVTVGAEAAADGQVRFWVHDDGAALSPEAQARLFVPFSRLSPQSGEGHGLGLSIVRRIAERLGGACGVESAPGQGTRFWFSLPAAPVPDASTSDASVPDAPVREAPEWHWLAVAAPAPIQPSVVGPGVEVFGGVSA